VHDIITRICDGPY